MQKIRNVGQCYVFGSSAILALCSKFFYSQTLIFLFGDADPNPPSESKLRNWWSETKNGLGRKGSRTKLPKFSGSTVFSSIKILLQLLRQVLDEKVLFNTEKPFDRRVLEGVVVTAAMNMQSEPVTSGVHQKVPERLKVSM